MYIQSTKYVNTKWIVSIACIIILFSSVALAQEVYRYDNIWPKLPQPWYLGRPVDVAVDTSGNVYVVDTANDRIQKFTPDGQLLTKWGSKGSGDGQFSSPGRIAVDADGNVYVSDSGNYRVQKFNSQGQFLAKWGGEGSGDGQFSDPTGIAADTDGNVYVADIGNHRIQKFTPDGQLLTKWEIEASENRMLSGPEGIAVDADGNVYVADAWNECVQKFNSQGQFLAKWGGEGSGDGQFSDPRGIAVDADGNVYVADRGNHRIQKFNSQGQFLTKWGSRDWGDGQFDSPTGIAVDDDGNVYVTETFGYRVQKFNSQGQFLAKWGSRGSGDGQFSYPAGIAVDADGNVYVADIGNHRIQKFNSQGQFLTKWGSEGSGDGQFSFISTAPGGIAVDADGTVYVTDIQNHRIQKFNSQGQFLAKWGSKGPGNGQFNFPEGIAVDADGNVYVADSGQDRIQKFNSQGQFLGKIGKSGSDAGQLNSPSGLSIGRDKNVYVTDANDRIQVFQAGTPRTDKAIIVAGGGPYTGNSLWDSTQMCSNFAYRSLNLQGFDKETIYYLTHDTDLDLDGNTLPDDVDGIPTNENLRQAVTQWAPDAQSLIVYLTDHGGMGTFGMSATEVLDASELDAWLDELQQIIGGKVTVIYDACHAGSFLAQLTPPPGKERIVITSTSPDELAYFLSSGAISFSYYFWSQILNGAGLHSAFVTAKQAIELSDQAKQSPLLDADGNGIGNEKADHQKVADEVIGIGSVTAAGIPLIGTVSPDQELNGEATAAFWADVTALGNIARVWAVILPPDYHPASSSTPIMNLPSVNLRQSGNNHYEGSYDSFLVPGTYEISIYAADDQSLLSVPVKTTVTQLAGTAPVEVNSDAPEVEVSFSPNQLVHLTFKTEPGQKIWVFLRLPDLYPDIEFARPSDTFCQQQGRWVFPFTGDMQSLYYLESCTDFRIDFGTNNFTGLGSVVITIKNGESPESLETIQTVTLRAQP